MAKLQALQEANRRGILPESKRAAFDEAVRRGLIQGQAPVQAPTPLRAAPAAPREIPTPTLRPVSAGVAPPGTAPPLQGEGGEVVTLAPRAPKVPDPLDFTPAESASIGRFGRRFATGGLLGAAAGAVAESIFPPPPRLLTPEEIPGGVEISKQQKAEQDTLVANAVTPELRKHWEALGPIGFIESAQKMNKYEMLPWLEDMESAKGNRMLGIINKLRNGEFVTQEEIDDHAAFVQDAVEISVRGYTFQGKLVRALLPMPAFAIEIAPIIALAAATKGRRGGPLLAAAAAKQGVKKTLRAALLSGAKKAAVVTVATPIVMLPRALKGYRDSKLNESIGITDKGRIFIAEAEKTPAQHAMRVLGNLYIEVATEIFGGPALRAIAKKSGLGKLAGKIAGRTLPKAFVVAVKEAAEKATNLPFAKAMEKIGYDGILEEITEERLADIARVVLDLDEEEGFSVDQLGRALFPGWEQILVEFGVITIFGVVSRTGFALGDKLRRRGVSKEKIDAVMQNLSELEKEAALSNFVDIEETQVEQDLEENLTLLADLEALDLAKLSAKKRQETEAQIQQTRIDVDRLETRVAERAAQIQVQETTGFRPLLVPKKPETLSQFIIRKGGLNLDTEEAGRLTSKETPSLGGVAKKTGKLSVDDARELAAEAGFIPEGTDQFGVITALEREAAGEDIVRDADLGALQEREAILAFNAQQEIEAAEITELTTFQEAFKEGVALASKDIKAAQEVLIEAIEGSGLTLNDRAKFLRTIKNIQTPAQLAKAAPDIEARILRLLQTEAKRIENPAKVNLRARIKKIIGSVKKRKDVAVDIRVNIRDLEADLKTTGVLAGGRIADTPIERFEEALGKAQVILAEGKAQLAINKAQKQQRQIDRLVALQEDTVAISHIDLKEAGLNEVLGVVDKAKNLFINGINRAQRLNINKNPMDVIADIMDGFMNYLGATTRVFKQTMDRAHNAYLQLKEEVTRPIKDLSDKLKLTEVNYKRIGTWAALQQKSGREKLLNSGRTAKEMDTLKLSDGEMEMFVLMRKALDSLRPALQLMMRLVYNKDFTRVKDYFPFMTDFKAMNDMEIQQMFGLDAPLLSDTAAEFAKKDVSKGFTKERKGAGKQKIRIDALNVFLTHVENATYLIEMAQPIKELGELAASSEYREIAGDFGQAIWVDWIDLLARKGRVEGRSDFFDTLRKNVAVATLGGKLASALIQPTALLDGAAFVGGSYVSRGIKNVANKEWRVFMKKNMPEIRERVGDDPNYVNLEGDGLLKDVKAGGMYVLKKLDLFAASAVASGAYIKSVEQRGLVVDLTQVDALAIEEAQLAVRRTQSSSFAKDAPPIISQAKLTGIPSIDSLITQFQSFMFGRWSLIQHDMIEAGLLQKRTKQGMNIAMFLILANIAEVQVRHYSAELVALMTGGEPPEDKDQSLTEVVARQAISNVPFVSSIVSAFTYGSFPVPAVSIWQAAVQKGALSSPARIAETAGLIGGLGLGIPGTLQAKQVLQGRRRAEKKKKKKRSTAGTK